MSRNFGQILEYFINIYLPLFRLAVTRSTKENPANSMPKGPANEWSIEEVIQFITATDSALGVHADLFQKHVMLHFVLKLFVHKFTYYFASFSLQEIDGKALLLLNSDMMMKYMDLKLGPALKICNLLSRVNLRLTPTKEKPSPSKPAIPMPKGPANEWSIEEVIQFITATDSSLGVHADLFRKHVKSHFASK